MVTWAIFYACLVWEEEKMRDTNKSHKIRFHERKTRQIYHHGKSDKTLQK